MQWGRSRDGDSWQVTFVKRDIGEPCIVGVLVYSVRQWGKELLTGPVASSGVGTGRYRRQLVTVVASNCVQTWCKKCKNLWSYVKRSNIWGNMRHKLLSKSMMSHPDWNRNHGLWWSKQKGIAYGVWQVMGYCPYTELGMMKSYGSAGMSYHSFDCSNIHFFEQKFFSQVNVTKLWLCYVTDEVIQSVHKLTSLFLICQREV